MGRKFQIFSNLTNEKFSFAKIKHCKTFCHVRNYILPILLITVIISFALNNKNDNEIYAGDSTSNVATYSLTIDADGGTYQSTNPVTGYKIQTVHSHNYASSEGQYNSNPGAYCGYTYKYTAGYYADSESWGDGTWWEGGFCSVCDKQLWAAGSSGGWGTRWEGHTHTDTKNLCSRTTSPTYSYSKVTLSVPTRTGYDFNGWVVSSGSGSVSGNEFTFAGSNATVKATWIDKVCTVTYNYNGATEKNGNDNIGIIYGNKVGTLPAPTKTNCLFEGWYYNGSKVSSDTLIYDDITLEARWTTFSLSSYSYEYEARDIKPSPVAISNAGSTQSSSYYSVSYTNNRNVGTATLTITGDGTNLVNTISINYTIIPKTINVNDIEIYNGSSLINESNPLVRERKDNDKTVLDTLTLKYHLNGEEVIFNHNEVYQTDTPNWNSTLHVFNNVNLQFSNISINTYNGISQANYSLSSSSVTKTNYGKIIDTTNPKFIKIETVANTYGKNQEIVFTLTSDEDIICDSTSSIKLLFKSKMGDKANNIVSPIEIDYDKSQGTNNTYSKTKKFVYKVEKGYMALNGITITEIKFSSAGFLDLYGNALSLEDIGLIQDSSLASTYIDTTDINVTITNNAAFTKDNITSDEEITYTFTFDKDIISSSFTNDDILINGLSDYQGKGTLNKIDDKTFTMVISNTGLFTPTGSRENLPFVVTVDKERVINSLGNENLKGENSIILDRALHEIECNEPTDSILKGSTVLMFPNMGNSIKYYENDPKKENLKTYSGAMLTIVLKNDAKDGVLNLDDMYQEKPEWVNSPKVCFTYTVRNGNHIYEDIININESNPYDIETNEEEYENYIKEKIKEYLKDEEDMQVLLGDDDAASKLKTYDDYVDVVSKVITESIGEIKDSSDLSKAINEVIDVCDNLKGGLYDVLGDNATYNPSIDLTNYEDMMIEYELFSEVQKDAFNNTKNDEGKSYYDILRERYLKYIEGNVTRKDIDSGNKIDDKIISNELIEIFGTLNALDSDGEKVEVLIDKINVKKKIDELEEKLHNDVLSYGQKERILIPYDIRIVNNKTNQPVTIKDGKSILVKIELPKEYVNNITNIYYINEDETVSNITKTIRNYNDHAVIYFDITASGKFIITSDLLSLIVSKKGIGNIDPIGYVVLGEDETEKTLSITIPQYYKGRLYYNDKQVADYKNGSFKYNIKNITSNGYIILNVEDDPEQKAADVKGPTFTVQYVENNKFAHQPYMNGYKDGTFRPNDSLTRAEACAILVRLSNNYDATKDYKEYLANYKDVKDTSWYANYVGYIIKCNIMSGYKNKFRPNDKLTRGEFAIILTRMFDIKDQGIESNFKDVDKNAYYYNGVKKVISAGVMTGINKKSFKPNEYVTRASTATSINKVLNRVPKDDISDFYKDKITSMYKDVKKNSWYFNDVLEATLAHEVSDVH